MSTKWPTGSDEDRLAQAMAAHDHERRWDTAGEILEFFGIDIDGDYHERDVRRIAKEVADRDGHAAIPLLIGVIEADNSYQTVYGIGNQILRGMTKVEYSIFHDGAWWHRWWESHRNEFPAEVAAMSIPTFDKTDFGQCHTPFPADTDSLQGKLRQIPQAIAEDRRLRRGAEKEPRLALWLLAGEIANHSDPRAIPYLIPLLEIGTPDFTYVCQTLQKLAKMNDQNCVRCDAAWWRQWWSEHRMDYPSAQGIEIPDYDRPVVFSWEEKVGS